MSGRALPVLVAVLALAYVVCAQLGARTGPPWLAALAVGCLIAAALLPALFRGNRPAFAVAAIAALLLIAALRAGVPRLPGYFVPPLLLALVGVFFGRTLRAGSRPLIARVVAALDGEAFLAQPAVARYARGLTLAWTLWLAALAALCLALGASVQPDGLLAVLGVSPPFALDAARWSAWVALLGYGGVGLAFAGEFAVRRFVLPQAPKRSFMEFAQGVARLWPELRRP